LATGFSYDIITKEDSSITHFNHMIKQSQGIRRNGSAALELCFVAAGRLDGFWEHKLSPWDMAAGSLLITEAGGKVTTFTGGIFNIYGDEILGTNGKIHEEMINVFSQTWFPVCHCERLAKQSLSDGIASSLHSSQ
jgi:myo-inositol-1(or 4)-monophosphatase